MKKYPISEFVSVSGSTVVIPTVKTNAMYLDNISNRLTIKNTGSTNTIPYITDIYTSAQTNANFLSANTFNNQVNFNINTTGNITAVTFYGDGGNLTNITADWNGLQIITAGENLVNGDLVFLSNDSKYYKASNMSENSASTELRIITEVINTNNSGNALVQGRFTTSELTSGEHYWVGNAGNFTNIQPTADNVIVRYVGTALSSTILEFKPDPTYIEIVSDTIINTKPSLRTLTSSGALLSTDYTVLTRTSGLTFTLPTAVGVDGKIYNIKNLSGGEIIINTTSSQTIDDGQTSISINNPVSLTIQSDGTNWILI